MQFDFDEWPSTHTDDTKYIRPYNGSLFAVREEYKNIFPDLVDNNPNPNEVQDSSKHYKIKYELNTLSLLGEHVVENDGVCSFKNEGVYLMEMFYDSDELSIFS